MKRYLFLFIAVLFFAFVLGACADQGGSTPTPEPVTGGDPGTGGEPVDPDIPDRPIQYYIWTGPNAPLSDRALVASGVYDDLTVDRYPLFLMLIREEGALENYIARQGLSEEEFLNHPKLPEFVKSHLVYEEVDVLELRSTPGASVTLESAAGTEVVIENQEGSNVDLANGVPIDLFCAEGRDPTYPNPGSTDEAALLCHIAEPIVEDFDWSR